MKASLLSARAQRPHHDTDTQAPGPEAGLPPDPSLWQAVRGPQLDYGPREAV